MKISPRKAEVTAVVELLKNGEFESPEQGARAVIKLVAELLGERSWYAYALRLADTGRPLLYGPFATYAKVQEFADELAIPGEHGVFWVHSPSAALESRNGADLKPPTHCTQCGHPILVHSRPRSASEKCTINGCDCEAPISGGKAE